ncbi:hypothetical protein LXL04_011497 [Taraxacum kok-saghyz]
MKRNLSNLVRKGFYTEALSLFSKLHFQSHPLNEFTFPFLLKACTQLKLLLHGQMLHAHLTKTGFSSDIYTATSLTDMYFKFQLIESALKVFDEITEPTTTLINVVLSGFSQNKHHKKCLDVFKQVTEYGPKPDSATIAILLSDWDINLKYGLQIHCWAAKIGVETDIYVATSLLTMYSNFEDPMAALIVFKHIHNRNIACYNAFLTGLLQNQNFQPVLETFKQMLQSSNQIPNPVTFLSVLSACSDLKNLKFGRQVHGLLVKLNLELNVLTGTALLDMYSKCGYWHWAHDVFKSLEGVRTLITWNSMISGMMMNGEIEIAVNLFSILESERLKPDSATWNCMINGFSKTQESFLFFKKMIETGEPPSTKSITSLLSACASTLTLSSGKEIHGYVIRNGIENDEFVTTALVNMYMKCGQPSRAFSVFNNLEIKPTDPVIWNAMISGYGRNGEIESAFDVFNWMLKENVKPNPSTFNSVLSVCSHGGKVEKSLEILRLLRSYDLVPGSEHYGSVIDVLGRSGRIDEARGVLMEIPEVSGSVLASLLGASRVYSDVKTGEEVARLLAEIDPESTLPFVVLSSIYAAEGRWKDVEKVRNEMDRKRLKKISGVSSVIMNYDPSEDLFGIYADLQPRKGLSVESSPRSWFGPNGQYIRELPCPSCRGRGYTPCTICGIERSRLDCSQCNGKGMVTCHQCSGECVIWEESIDERPWEKARSISPLKVKEDDDVDNLEIKLASRKKSKRVYRSPSPESLNAKTGLFTNRMKIIHGDPKLHAQRVAAIKKSKGSDDARKRASESMKAFFSDPENRHRRSISMKGVDFYCKNCGRLGHRRHYCPELDDKDRRFRCSLCGEKGHNRRSCKKFETIESEKRNFNPPCCSICGKPGHNRRTCIQKTMAAKTTATKTLVIKTTTSVDSKKRAYTCRVCRKVGHNSRTCPSHHKLIT